MGDRDSLGRIDIDLDDLIAAVAADGFTELPVRFVHTRAIAGLPRLHDDPFDQLLIVQSVQEGRRLVTRDDAILAYSTIPGFDPLSR